MLFDIGVDILFVFCRVISSHVASHGTLLGILEDVQRSLIATFLYSQHDCYVFGLSPLCLIDSSGPHPRLCNPNYW